MNEEGHTLVELLIIIVVLVFLVAWAVVIYLLAKVLWRLDHSEILSSADVLFLYLV